MVRHRSDSMRVPLPAPEPWPEPEKSRPALTLAPAPAPVRSSAEKEGTSHEPERAQPCPRGQGCPRSWVGRLIAGEQLRVGQATGWAVAVPVMLFSAALLAWS